MNKGVVQLICSSVKKDWFFPFKQGENYTTYGSGFMFSKERKYILTCSHCIENVIHIYVQIPKYGKKRFEAKVVSLCKQYDIALLEINDFKDNTIPFLELDKNGLKNTKAGDTVEVLGYPLGQDNLKMTQGIVSGHQMSLYQIDSPINGGNSGGPLLRESKVIGIISSGILFANDIGYAVPIERFLNIYEIMKKKKLIYPPFSFGVLLQKNPLYGKDNLAYIYNILPNSLIEYSKPKIKKGDILLKLGNYKVNYQNTIEKKWMFENQSLQDFLYENKINSKLSFQILRNKKKITGHILLKEMNSKLNEIIHPYQIYEYILIGGLVIIHLSLEVLQDLIHKIFTTFTYCSNIDNCHKNIFVLQEIFNNMKNKNQENIILIINILNGSLFDEYNFSKGDFLTKINNIPIKSIQQIYDLVYVKKNTKIIIETNLGKKCIISKNDIKMDNEKMKEKYEITQIFKYKK
jgi:S1-C subfamily serine protease